MSKIYTVLLSLIVILVIIAGGGYFFGGQILYKYMGPEYFFEHPTVAKILNVTPVCPTFCLPGGVCGKDGKNYCNQCIAFQHGAGYAHDGACVAVKPVVDPTAGWQTYTDSASSFQMKYPKTFSDTVWRAQTWPPTIVAVGAGANPINSCAPTNSSQIPFTLLGNKTINSMNFAIYGNSDAGAGQLYTDYCYVLNSNNKYYAINFVIHSTNGCGNGNCGPYCGTPNELACKNFDMQKEVVGPIENIVSTFKFTK